MNNGWVFVFLVLLSVATGARAQDEPVSVQFNLKNNTEILGPVTFVDPKSTTDDSGYVFDFYKMGVFLSGEYKGYDFILAVAVYIGPCKGDGCSRPNFCRFARLENRWVFLSKISEQSDFYLQLLNDQFGKVAHQTFDSDWRFNLPNLSYPPFVAGPSPRQVIQLVTERLGDFPSDKSILSESFQDPLLGKVYTTQPQASLSQAYYYHDFSDQAGEASEPKDWQKDEEPDIFRTNGFFVFRPDGTYLIYRCLPYFTSGPNDDPTFEGAPIFGLFFSDQSQAGRQYDYQTHTGCEAGEYADFESVVSADELKSSELKPIGSIPATGDPIFAPVKTSDPLYQNIYKNYRANCSSWYANGFSHINYGKGYTAQPLSLDKFIAAKPLFLWKDPFGRWVRFLNRQFLPPSLCEPVVYLYPAREQEVQVTVEPQGGVRESSPNYVKGWKVRATTNGQLTDLADGKKYPYLFWEGDSPIFPMQSQGFVVAREDLNRWFDETLARLGLNSRESADFKEAWLPKMKGAPYFFITFYGNDVMDRIAPLSLDPKPDSVIRILMDYRPLRQKEKVTPLTLPSSPERKGFTVIEWGGIKR